MLPEFLPGLKIMITGCGTKVKAQRICEQ